MSDICEVVRGRVLRRCRHWVFITLILNFYVKYLPMVSQQLVITYFGTDLSKPDNGGFLLCLLVLFKNLLKFRTLLALAVRPRRYEA